VTDITLSSRHTSYERLACNINIGPSKLILVCIYRPPPAPAAVFFEEINDLLDEVSLMTGSPLILGDFNCPSDGASCDLRLLRVMDGFGLSQGVLSPTRRVTGAGGARDSLLDLVFFQKVRSFVHKVEVYDVGLSDHCLVTVLLNLTTPPNIIKTFKTRNIRNLCSSSFMSAINNCSFNLTPADSVDAFCSQMVEDVTNVLNRLAPEQEVTKRIGRHPPHCLTQDALLAKRRRRTLEKKFTRNRTLENQAAYRSACRRATRLIRISSQEYTKNLVESVLGNSKKVWAVCKDLLYGPTVADMSASGLTAASFIKFFQDKLDKIKLNIATSLMAAPVDVHTDVNPKSVPPPFSGFAPVSVDTVRDALLKMTSKTNVLDFIPTFLLKEHSGLFAPSLTHLCNLSFSQGLFPTVFKTGCITPILKKNGLDICELGNYRPITGLNNISKLLERVALIQLRPVIVGSNHFAKYQSAYRASHSTETALLRLTNDVRSSMGRSTTTSLLSLDISAAFDALDHSILLTRATKLFGISGLALHWLESYLTDRAAFVKYNNNNSPTVRISSGVPQGSILGPILFSLYVSPIGSIITGMGASYHQYADDTQLYIELNPTHDSASQLTACADCLNLWFLRNNLMLNTSKTDCILFGTGARLRHTDEGTKTTCTPFTGTVLPVRKSIHILGVTLDAELNMNKHVSETVASCNAHIRALRHIRPSLPQSVAASLSCAIVQTRLDYCNSLLYETSSHNISSLQRVQNNLARVVFRTHRRASAAPLLAKLHWLPIASRIRFKVAALSHSVVHTGCPKYLSELVSFSEPARKTRGNHPSPGNDPSSPSVQNPGTHKLAEHRCRLASERPSFGFAAPAVWNSLPRALRQITSPITFRKALKTELFSPPPP